MWSLSRRTRNRPSGSSSVITPSNSRKSSLDMRLLKRIAGTTPTQPRRAPLAHNGLGVLQIDRRFLAAAAVLLQFIGQALAFIEGAQVRTLDGGDVHEHVLAAVFGLDEAVALAGVEPLHSTDGHV